MVESGSNRPCCTDSVQARCYSLIDRIKKLPFLGLIIVFASAGLFTFCNVIVKQVDLDPFTIATYRFVGIALPAFPIVIARQEDVFPRGKAGGPLLAIRDIVTCHER